MMETAEQTQERLRKKYLGNNYIDKMKKGGIILKPYQIIPEDYNRNKHNPIKKRS